jgi:hypothetical protein
MLNVKRIVVALLISGMLSIGILGCAEKSSTKTETRVKTPGGTTTITIEKEVKKTGENPPPARP